MKVSGLILSGDVFGGASLPLYTAPSYMFALGEYTAYIRDSDTYYYPHTLIISAQGISISGKLISCDIPADSVQFAIGTDTENYSFTVYYYVICFTYGGTNYMLQSDLSAQENLSDVQPYRWIFVRENSGVCYFYSDITEYIDWTRQSDWLGTYYVDLGLKIKIEVTENGVEVALGDYHADPAVVYGLYLDGFDFVFNLATEGTFVYDSDTGTYYLFMGQYPYVLRKEGVDPLANQTLSGELACETEGELTGKTCSVVFGEDNSVTLTIGESEITVTGTYSYDAQSGIATVSITDGDNVTQLIFAYDSAGNVTLNVIISGTLYSAELAAPTPAA